MSDKIELLHDNPLKFEQNETEYEQDGLNFKTYTKVITNAIISTQTPFTVGIFGEWGKGKTSFLEIVKQKIEDHEYKGEIITVWFNAWQYEKEEHPIVPLIAVIIKSLETKNGTIKKGFGKFVDVLKSVAYGFSVETTNKDILGNEVKMQLNTKDMIDKYEQLVATALLDKSLYFNAFEKLEKFEELKGKKIIIFIDDLDRCLPPNAIKLLESIKLVLSQKGFVFVLGVAKEVLEGHLNHKYKEEFGIKEGNHGKAYLEKMIQLPFTLPKFAQKVESLVHSLFSKIQVNDDITNIKEVINAIATHSKVTPRLLVRLINQAKIHSEIDKELEVEAVYGDMYAAFVFVLLLDAFYEKEYKILSVQVQSKLTELLNIEENLEKVKEIRKNEESHSIERKLSELDIIYESIKENECFRKLLESKVGKNWLENESLRSRTIEFVEITTSASEEEKQKRKEKKLENQTLEELRNELLSLEEKIKNEDDFKKYITKDKDISYDTFIKVEDENGKEFEMSKYLITNEWYAKFKDGEKEDFGEEFNHPFKPAIGVSFSDINKFCEYLNSFNDGYKYSLPTKEQFDYIASGRGKNRNYPWGDKYNNKFCNNDKVNLGSTSIVGVFENGKSIDGIHDMSGNVWKWTNSYYKKDKSQIILKGASWEDIDVDLFSINDYGTDVLSVRDNITGFFLIRNKV